MFSGSKPRTSGESQGSAEAEVRRQRRRRTETRETRHEARREAETVLGGPEVKNRFLAEAEASSVKTASTRIADTVTFVEVEAETSEKRAGSKGESWQKFDKSKWITFDTRDVTSLCQNVSTVRVNIYRRDRVPNLFLSKVDIYVQISSISCGQLLG